MRRMGIWSAVLLSCQVFSCGQRETAVAPPSRPAPRAPASAPAPDEDRDAAAELDRLEAAGQAAVEKEDHGQTTAVAAALERLEFSKPENAALRDALAGHFRTEAVRLRAALHRFLFTELADLPAGRRTELLDLADSGQADAVERAGAALAEHRQAGRRVWLRATPTLKPHTIDPASGLPVRPAGLVKRIWQSRFNQAFNTRMRQLTSENAATRPRT